MEIKYTGMELKLHRHGIRTALASVFGAMLIATPLVGDSGLANGIVMGKVFWFHLSMALMAIGTVVTAWLGGRKSIPFALPDGLLLLFAGITLATYDWQLDPEPEKLLFGGQLVVLWFLLRYFLTEAPCLKFFFLFVLMLTGLVEAVWGMQQLHGYAYSNHSLFRLTGHPVGLPVDGVAVSKGDALFRLGMRRSYPDCPACRNEPVGVDSGGRGLRMGVLDGTDRMGEDESCI